MGVDGGMKKEWQYDRMAIRNRMANWAASAPATATATDGWMDGRWRIGCRAMPDVQLHDDAIRHSSK